MPRNSGWAYSCFFPAVEEDPNGCRPLLSVWEEQVYHYVGAYCKAKSESFREWSERSCGVRGQSIVALLKNISASHG
jgi:hypothetical protein